VVPAFCDNLTEQINTIEDCLERGRIIPCLCLIYSSIDVIASLERRPNEDTKAAFVRWVSDNMSKTKPLPCTPLELYAARCGILHTFTADSDLSRKGKVRPVIYAWGNAHAADLSEASRRLGRTEVAVHLRDLIDSFRNGLAAYLEELGHKPDRMRQVEKRAGLWFTRMNQERVKEFLRVSADSAH
jgi:hypothetical protein